MQRQLPVVTYILAIATCVLALAGGGHYFANSVITAQQDRQLNELAQLALRRAEVVVNQGSAMLDGLMTQGLVGCDPVAIQNIRFNIYQTSQVKDIRQTDETGAVRCSAFPETLEFDRTWPTYADMQPSLDGALRLFKVDQFSGVALGVFKSVDDARGMVSIVSLRNSILDVMPADLRDTSTVSIGLGDGSEIAQITGKDVEPDAPAQDFSAASAQYPIQTNITVSDASLFAWNHEIYVPMVAASALLGLALGVLLARNLTRPVSILSELDRAIANAEFTPFYQPTFDLQSGRITGCEMLARWTRANGETISPARFIPLAEESGRINEITWQLMQKALTELGPHLRENKTFVLSFNASPQHFMEDGFLHELENLTKKHSVARRQVCIEITERDPFENLDAAAAMVARARDAGFKVAIDDVGIGHSGLSHLQALRADTIKIDKFFVDAIGADETARSIIEMLVRLAAKLDMDLVAEGIEHDDQIAALITCGVPRGQGYVCAPPLTASDFTRLISDNAGTRARSVSNAA